MPLLRVLKKKTLWRSKTESLYLAKCSAYNKKFLAKKMYDVTNSHKEKKTLNKNSFQDDPDVEVSKQGL